MTYSPPVLDLDPTGINPNNRVVNEPHTLSNRPTRSIAPKKGPFFAQSITVQHGGTVYARGQDYQLVELHQEATLKYGKEICSVILIINKDIPTNVTIGYQALGGHFTNAGFNDSIANLYQSVINDNRPVDWSNIFNKPTEFNPAIHRHLLEDVYGFEAVVDGLERIKRAITLGQTSIVLEIVNALISKFKRIELPKVLPSSKLMQYDAFLYFITRRKMLHNIWIDQTEENWVKGQVGRFQIDTSGYPVGTTLYWSFYKENNANVALFSIKEGTVVGNGGIVDVSVYVPSSILISEPNIYIGVKDDISADEFKAVTYVVDVDEVVTSTSGYGYMLMSSLEVHEHEKHITYYDSTDELRLWYTLSNY